MIKMVNDNFSCLKEVTKNVPITLSCEYQANEITGISDVLESWKRQYIKEIQGIVVNYKNVCLLSTYAYIKSDYPVIMCNVKATFELFVPTVGNIAKGIINRISYDYIGCLVHNTINVTINRSNEPAEVSDFIALDQDILFEITHLGFKRKIIRVKGNITEKCTNLMKTLNFPTVNTKAISNNRVTYTSDSNEDVTEEEYKKSDDINFDEGSQSQSLLYNANLYFENPSNRGSDSRKKKRKKSDSSVDHPLKIGNFSESQSLLDNSTDLFSESLSDTSHASLPKKRKISKSEHKINNHFEFPSNEIITNHSIISREDSTDSGCPSPKKKKRKLSAKISSNNDTTIKSIGVPNVPLKEDISTDTSSHHSTSSKKKKHKKSKNDPLNSPSIFSDSLSSSKDGIEPFKIPVTPAKRKKKSQDKFSVDKKTSSLNSSSSVSPQKLHSDYPEDFEKLMETFSMFDPSVIKTEMLDNIECNNVENKSSDLIKMAKKRKQKSSHKDGLPKKKRKTEENENIIFKKSSSSHKDKKDKKNKDKPKKHSKKDKKKKVISSKKKLPKLKKKKDRSGKSKNKKSKKSSKRKEKDIS